MFIIKIVLCIVSIVLCIVIVIIICNLLDRCSVFASAALKDIVHDYCKKPNFTLLHNSFKNLTLLS